MANVIVKAELQTKGVNIGVLVKNRSMQNINQSILAPLRRRMSGLAKGIIAMGVDCFPFKDAGVQVAKYTKPTSAPANHMGAAEQVDSWVLMQGTMNRNLECFNS